jgi:hypothetical protein
VPPYQPQIATAEQVRQETESLALGFSNTMKEAVPADQMEKALAFIRDEASISAFVEHLPLVHRWISAEMDTDAPSKRGIGRLADGDPPPRFGAKYRKQLEDPEARAAIGLGVERLVLAGYCFQAAFFTGQVVDRAQDVVWAGWLRHLTASYNETNDLSSRAGREEESTEGYLGALMIGMTDHGGAELLEGFETYGILKGRGINPWRNARAMTYLTFFIGAGRALRQVVSDQFNESFGSLLSLHLLEDYEQPRNKRQMLNEA